MKESVTELGEARALPRIDASIARALNRLYSATVPFEITLPAAPHTLRWRVAAAAVVAAPVRHAAYRFRLGTSLGRVGLDDMAATAVFGERQSNRLPRELRYVLLADALHALAQAVEKNARMRFEWAPAEDADGDVAPAGPVVAPSVSAPDAQRAAWFSATTAHGSVGGFVEFDDAAVLDALLAVWDAPAPAASRSFDWLRVPIPFCLGTTGMSLRELSSIRPGDIISIETWVSAGTALQVCADIGGAAGRRLVGLAENTQIIIQQWNDTAMNRDTHASSAASDDNDAASLPLDRLDALEVTLRFEVGDLAVTLGELKGIRAGHVFDLAQPLNRSAVRILAHGNVLGKGHLVAVGDRLGVRVSEFAPSEI